MVQYKGVPELNNLLETARNIQLPTDEYWVLALCSSNLIEAIVNKKLKELDMKIEGAFKQKYLNKCHKHICENGSNLNKFSSKINLLQIPFEGLKCQNFIA